MSVEVARAGVADGNPSDGMTATLDASAAVDALGAAFARAGDAERAAAMAAYMKGIAPFFGVPAPERRRIQRAVLDRWKPDEHALVEFARAAWNRPSRELHYAACDLLQRNAAGLSADVFADLEWLITHKSWWDTVDSLAPVVGVLVGAVPSLDREMDRWIDADDFWLARVAIIHQLRRKLDTDADRLFRYCLRRAADQEFFVRKAIGWALREYAKSAPDAVRAFVDAHESELSPLSKREARKHL